MAQEKSGLDKEKSDERKMEFAPEVLKVMGYESDVNQSWHEKKVSQRLET